MSTRQRFLLVGTVLTLVLGGAGASELHVNCRTGSDKNDGTMKAPLATIGKAMAMSEAGDIVKVAPGTYAEEVKVQKDGITVESLGDEQTVLIGTVAVPVKAFKPVDGVAGVFVWPLPAGLKELPWIFYNGQKLVQRYEPLRQNEDRMCFHVEMQGKIAEKLQVNINGKNLPPTAKIEVPVRNCGILVKEANNVTIRGFRLQRFAGNGISLQTCRNCLVEYCVVEESGYAGIAAAGCDRCTFRRNAVYFCNHLGLYYTSSEGLLEENLVVANHYGWNQNQFWGGQIKGNGIKRSTIRYNFVCDEVPQETKVGPQTVKRTGWNRMNPGIWGDIGCWMNGIYGNAVARQNHAGIYAEASMHGTLIAFNVLQDCAMGVTFRTGSHSLVHHNWIFNQDALGRKQTFLPLDQGDLEMWGRQWFEGICLWYTQYVEPSRDNVCKDNLIQVSGRAVSVPTDKVEWEVTPSNTYERAKQNVLDHNLYNAGKRKESFALVSKTLLATFEDYQKATGWDANGRMGEFTSADIGLTPLWTVPPRTLHPETPVALLYDPSVECLDPLSTVSYDVAPYFWKAQLYRPWHLKSRKDYAWAYYRSLRQADGPQAHSGERVLEARGGKPETFSGGMDAGWWSVYFPVSSGTKMLVECWVESLEVAPHDAKSGTVVFAEFTDELGHNKVQHYVLGNGKMPSMAKGTYKWQKVGERVTVPHKARWMRVFLGLRNSAGTVMFDDIKLGL